MSKQCAQVISFHSDQQIHSISLFHNFVPDLNALATTVDIAAAAHDAIKPIATKCS